MSYLNTLARAKQNPATDYLLCLFQRPTNRDMVEAFFTSEEVLDLWQDLSDIEMRLYDYQKAGLEAPEEEQLQQAWGDNQARYSALKEASPLFSTHQATITSPQPKADTATKKQTAKAFLLSLAGMFESGVTDTSENVRSIVEELIVQKHE